MLEKLSIKNIALIDSVEITFNSGLNVLSGETGSGKSVIIEALNFVLGAKADKSFIRSGQEECFVSAEFSINYNDYSSILSDLDVEEDNTLIISRKFNLDGRSTVKINGVTVTVSMLRKISSKLVDVHGQSEHFDLLSTSNQLKLIDKICYDDTIKLREEINSLYSEYKDVLKSLEEFGGDETKRLIRLDVLKYQINEIEKTSIKENEEENLTELKNSLLNQEKIQSALCSTKSALSDEGGVLDVLNNANRLLYSISNLSDNYLEIYDRLSASLSEIEDINSSVLDLAESLDDSHYSLDEIEVRLDVIKNIKKKYGQTYEEVQKFYNDALLECDKLENYNVLAEQLLNKKLDLKKLLYKLFIDLSSERRRCARDFSYNVLNELKELGMEKAAFNINFAPTLSFEEFEVDSSNGFDKIEFMFSANSGEPLKPMGYIISGGEMSRFMLSIKAQSSRYSEVETFIFDEIDVGISGNVAKIVAQKFVKISNDTQIIAITHLPQISAIADHNLLIEKKVDGESTKTYVRVLNHDEKINEIIRLTGGEIGNQTSISHARDLINQANNIKNSLKKV